jgi:hypothetical protein
VQCLRLVVLVIAAVRIVTDTVRVVIARRPQRVPGVATGWVAVATDAVRVWRS